MRHIAIAIGLLMSFGLALEAQRIPGQLSDEAFRKMITDFSEPEGYFQYENFVSNEDDFQVLLPAVAARAKSEGVFIGVGPEQNFTYIAAFKPAIAFIVDIRRQNMIEHLFYKSLFELSSDRADFVSRLFARPRPPRLNNTSTVTEVFQAFEAGKTDQKVYDSTLAAVYDHLTRVRGFQLSSGDREAIAKIYTAFFQGGPQMDYRFSSYTAPTASYTYTQLMTSTDRDGKNWSYLASEENFRRIQDYQKKNLIVPLVGDFAGPKTVRAIGQYAKENRAIVSVFYSSNVDEYLFRDAGKDRFFASVATLPMDSNSTIIRFVGGPGGLSPAYTIQIAPGKRWAALWCSMPDLVTAFQERKLSARVEANRLCMR